jgi:hypothetical protein
MVYLPLYSLAFQAFPNTPLPVPGNSGVASEQKANMITSLLWPAATWKSPAMTGKKRFLTTDATSSYEAVERAIKAWSLLWFCDADAIATVKHGEQSWSINVRKVIDSRTPKDRRNVQ